MSPTKDVSGVALVAEWTLSQLLWSPRTIAMGVVALVPTVLVLVYRALSAADVEMPLTGFGFFSLVTAVLGFQFVAPMLALFYSTGLIADEVDSGTITYLITRPRSRHAILMGKMLGSFALQVILFVPALVLAYYLALAPSGWSAVGRNFPALVRDVAAGVLGLAAYSGLFAATGAFLRRPVLIGLGFVFGWEAFVTYVPGFLRRLTVAHYIQSLLPHESFQGALSSFLSGRTSSAVAAVALSLVAILTHGLALFFFARREYASKNV